MYKPNTCKAWQHWVDRGARQYEKEFGGSKAFDKATRTHLAEQLAKRYERGEDI